MPGPILAAYDPFKGHVLAGVSRRVVDAAQCPVLVLPRGMQPGLEDILGPVIGDAATA